MHLGITALLEFYRRHREEDSLVLATIIDTEGSTYRKPGAMMLISPGGEYEGMISGGCLEGDLLQHAEAVFASGQVAFVTYDMHADDDLVWSLGLGCDGIIHLMLQRLDRESGFGFLGQLELSRAANQPALLALVSRPGSTLPCGSLALIDRAGAATGIEQLRAGLQAASRPWPQWRVNRVCLNSEDSLPNVLQVSLPAATRVLICGAGPDAVPVARILSGLDWKVTIVDHRPAFADAGRFPSRCRVILCRPENLQEEVGLAGLDAVVIMSHHLESDGKYLRQISRCDVPYVGVLGPVARRERLREIAACNLQLYGPAGLDIGAELPGAIALSIAAEIHAVLNQRDGLPLTHKADRT